MKKNIFITALFVLAIASACAAGNDPQQGQEKTQKWDQMSDSQKADARDAYTGVTESPDSIRQYLANGGKKIEDLPPAERARMKKFLHEWEKLSPRMKEAVKEKYRKWTSMSREQREKLKDAKKRYEAATAEQKAKIREEARKKVEKKER
jgi:hypothetical protein